MHLKAAANVEVEGQSRYFIGSIELGRWSETNGWDVRRPERGRRSDLVESLAHRAAPGWVNAESGGPFSTSMRISCLFLNPSISSGDE
jgi:hypothetical protein